MHFVGVVLGLSGPHTQTTPEERAALARHVRGKKHVVEIGVFEGLTTRHLCEHSDPDAKVYGIDPFAPGRLGICWTRWICQLYNKGALGAGKLHLIARASPAIGDECPPVVDFVFIDADHSFEGIRRDWQFWTQKLPAGGVVALHDTILRSNEPELGSHEYFRSHIRFDEGFDLIDQVDSLSILRRR